MHKPNMTLLYVADPVASAKFYQDLLGAAPIEVSPGFAMFAFGSDMLLGLWKLADVIPQTDAKAFGGELGFSVASPEALHALFDDWKERKYAILQTPTQMDFSLTFCVADPDGHRLRVYVASA